MANILMVRHKMRDAVQTSSSDYGDVWFDTQAMPASLSQQGEQGGSNA
ncbi:hypothetical protein [Brenneria uluponensis]|nr:hypothetical protein [Brenneria ulupoensis]